MVVVMGQVPKDASLRGLPDYRQWLRSSLARLSDLSHRPVVFRPHPKSQTDVVSFAAMQHGSLQETLDSAHVVVTYNSNSGVDAILDGVPVIAIDLGSMAWSVASHEFTTESVEHPWRPSQEERLQWAYDLAYTQWSEGEIAHGHAWDHLRNRFEEI